MSSEPITLKSGHVFEYTVAGFTAASELKRVIASELLKVEVTIDKLDLNMELDLKKIDPKTLATLKNVVCALLASEAVERSFFKCADRCLLEGQRIVKDTFDPEDMRGDFLPVAWEVISRNLALFFAGLDLKSSGSVAPSESSPR